MSSINDKASDQVSGQSDQRQAVWMALSDLFIDNEIGYESIAERVAHLSIPEIQHVLFYEVAPVCMSNLLVLTPANSKGFTEDDIFPKVEQHLQKMKMDRLYRQKVRLKAKFYKVFLKQDWLKVIAKISDIQSDLSINNEKV